MVGGSDVGLVVAFLAGFASCISPCVAPLIPGYLALLTGTATGDPIHEGGPNWRLIITSLAFVAGFSLVFVTLGASAAAFGGLLDEYRRPLGRLAGVFMLVMGLVLLGALRLPWLLRERRWQPQPHQFRPSEALLLGMAFGFGWTPCFGPVLAVILAYASTVETVREGTLLLSAYALGLGLPFLLLGFSVGWIDRLARFLRRRRSLMNATSGLTMLALGGLFLTDRFFYVTIAFQRYYYAIVGG